MWLNYWVFKTKNVSGTFVVIKELITILDHEKLDESHSVRDMLEQLTPTLSKLTLVKEHESFSSSFIHFFSLQICANGTRWQEIEVDQ